MASSVVVQLPVEIGVQSLAEFQWSMCRDQCHYLDVSYSETDSIFIFIIGGCENPLNRGALYILHTCLEKVNLTQTFSTSE